MSRVENRFRSLERKTEGFISGQDLDILVGYFQGKMLEEEYQSDRFKKTTAEIEDVHRRFIRRGHPGYFRLFMDLIGEGYFYWIKGMVIVVSDLRDRYPEGLWLPNEIATWYHEHISYSLRLKAFEREKKLSGST